MRANILLNALFYIRSISGIQQRTDLVLTLIWYRMRELVVCEVENRVISIYSLRD